LGGAGGRTDRGVRRRRWSGRRRVRRGRCRPGRNGRRPGCAGPARCGGSMLYQEKKAWQCTRAASIEGNRGRLRPVLQDLELSPVWSPAGPAYAPAPPPSRGTRRSSQSAPLEARLNRYPYERLIASSRLNNRARKIQIPISDPRAAPDAGQPVVATPVAPSAAALPGTGSGSGVQYASTRSPARRAGNAPVAR
jgi:hypothetical protein